MQCRRKKKKKRLSPRFCRMGWTKMAFVFSFLLAAWPSYHAPRPGTGSHYPEETTEVWIVDTCDA